jgi:hypothetical protein
VPPSSSRMMSHSHISSMRVSAFLPVHMAILVNTLLLQMRLNLTMSETQLSSFKYGLVL